MGVLQGRTVQSLLREARNELFRKKARPSPHRAQVGRFHGSGELGPTGFDPLFGRPQHPGGGPAMGVGGIVHTRRPASLNYQLRIWM